MRTISILACLLPLSLAAFSDPGGGSISGTILDLSGTPVSGATVEIKNPQGRAVFSTVSTGSGSYAIPQLPSGSYAITVKMKGMKPYSHAYLSVDKSSMIREDVTLELDENPEAAALPDDPPAVPTRVRKPSKDFYAEDAELELNGPTLSVDGKDVLLGRDASVVKGSIVWIYVPNHGKYLLSLRPHKELGLSLAGQVSGTSLWFQMQDLDIQIDADERIAPGSATYNLYVLYDGNWLPSSKSAVNAFVGTN